MAARVTQELVNMRGQLQGKEDELIKHKQEGRATNSIHCTHDLSSHWLRAYS